MKIVYQILENLIFVFTVDRSDDILIFSSYVGKHAAAIVSLDVYVHIVNEEYG